MNTAYEKHQRDYTILATSLVMEEFFSPNFENYYDSRTRPAYILIRDGILFHYFNIDEKKERSDNCLSKYSFADLQKYIAQIDVELHHYRHFVKKPPLDTTEALSQLHYYMTFFVTVIILCAETPSYATLNQKTLNLLMSARKRYDNVHKIAMDIQRQLLNKLAEQKNIAPNLLDKMMASEFRRFLKDGFLPKGLGARKKFFFARQAHNGGQILSLKEAKKILSKLEAPVRASIDCFSGKTAYKGKATGKVRIVQLIKDADNLKKGEILVTSMTDPRYLPIMKKAAAFITDEGGITCHAAIVARELKKPCLIGTKIATKVLHDGDLVEVDADKGIVKIIKK